MPLSKKNGFLPDLDAIPAEVAKKAKWKLPKSKKAFLVSGDDRVGAGARLLGKLADKRINVIAIVFPPSKRSVQPLGPRAARPLFGSGLRLGA